MALVTGGLHYPVPDGIGRGLELPCQLLGRLPAAHQLYEPVPELGRVCTTCLGHGDLLASSEDRCPPNRGNSTVDHVALTLANLHHVDRPRPVFVPNSAAWRATCATLALQISFLPGMQVDV